MSNPIQLMKNRSSDLPEMISKYKISIASLLVLIPSVIGAISFVDSRYAQATEIQELRQYQVQIQLSMEQQYSQIRRDDLDDKIFVLQMKKGQQNGKLSPLDEALLERYQSQLRYLNKPQRKE